MGKLDWSKFEPMFSPEWSQIIKPFFDNEGFEPIYERLKFDSRRGKKLFPRSDDVFKMYKITKPSDIKVVMLLLCPYHTAYNGIPVANGIPMDCSNTGKLQPSLDLFYEGLFKDLGYEGEKPSSLSYLVEQGVFLTNVALTTEERKPGSHVDIWEPFTTYIFEKVIAPSMVPVVFMGVEANKFKKYLLPFQWSFSLKHPASAAYNNEEYSTDKVFTSINKILKDTNNETINWIK